MIERILAIGFYIGIAAYFIYSFFFPVETDFWLMRNGFPIMILEFLTPIVILIIGKYHGKETGFKSTGTTSKEGLMVALLVVCIAALIVSFSVSNLLLFGYFLLSVILKFINSKSKIDMRIEGRGVFFTVVMWGVSMISAVPFSGIFLLFPSKIAEHVNFLKTLPGEHAGAIIDNPGLLVMWGTIYFLLLSIVIIPFVGKKLINIYNQFPIVIGPDGRRIE